MKIMPLFFSFCLFISSAAYADLNDGFAAYEKHDYKKAYLEFSTLAQAGDSEAQRLLSQMYMMGEYVQQNNKLSIEWLKKSALQGNRDAQSDLGVIYSHGSVGVTLDGKEAVKWFTLAANQGEWNALNQIGSMYIEGDLIEQNFDEAFKWRLKFVQAQPKSSVAAYELARMYAMGLGVAPDKKQAIDWYQSSINLNTEDVLEIPEFELGYLYYFGSLDEADAPPDHPQVDKTIPLWRSAALKDYLPAQYILAEYYASQGDFKNSYTFYKMAAKDDRFDDTFSIGLKYISGSEMKSAAQFKLAGLYERGEGVAKSISQAIFWYKKSARQSDFKDDANSALKRLRKK